MIAMTIAAIALSACPPGAAWWMPHRDIQNNSTAVLPMFPDLRIACCNDVLGALPLQKDLVTAVFPHRGWLYAIITNKFRDIECPPHSARWKNTAWLNPSRADNTHALPTTSATPQQGYTVSPDTNCVPYKTLNIPLEDCIQTCNSTSECSQVSILGPGSCGLCTSTRHRRESAGAMTYTKQSPHSGGPYGKHHPIIIAAVVLLTAVAIAVGATVYSSKDV